MKSPQRSERRNLHISSGQEAYHLISRKAKKTLTMTIVSRKCSLLAVLLPALVASETTTNTPRTEISIQFEHMLEVEGNHKTGSAHLVVAQIDSSILVEFQKNLPAEESSKDGGLPSIFFTEVESDIFGECSFSATSGECSLVRTTVLVSYQEEKSERSIEFVTLGLAQDFLADFSAGFSNVRSKYMFPRMEQSVAQFTILGVDQDLNSEDIETLESTILEVFGDTLFSVGGDTDILDAKYIYQEQKDNKLETHMMLTGICQTCTTESFGAIVDVVVASTLDTFRLNLKENANAIGSTTFDSAASVLYSTPEEPQFLDSLDEDTFIIDESTEITKHPWFFWYGICAFLILGAGINRFRKGLGASEKSGDNLSYKCDTTEPSDSDEPDDMEDIDLDNYNTAQRFEDEKETDTTSNPWLV
jgi:hypothetical protein